MAFTNKGDIQRMRPWLTGNNSALSPLAIPVTAATAYNVGDVVAIAAGKATLAVAGSTTILGVVLNKVAAIASPSEQDVVLIAPALPGALFVGTFVGGAATDVTATDAMVGTTTLYDIVVESDTGGSIYCVNQADTTGAMCRVIAYPLGQTRGRLYDSGVTLNPQVVFSFDLVGTVFA